MCSLPMKSSRYLGLVTWVALTYSRIYSVFAQTTTAVVSSLRLAKDGFKTPLEDRD